MYPNGSLTVIVIMITSFTTGIECFFSIVMAQVIRVTSKNQSFTKARNFTSKVITIQWLN